MTLEDLNKLLAKVFRGEATEEEAQKIQEWYNEEDEKPNPLSTAELAESKSIIYNKSIAELGFNKKNTKTYKLGLKPYFIAATLFLIGIGGYYYYHFTQAQAPQHYTKLLKADIGPGGANATLELSNGQVIALDQLQIGHAINQEGYHIEKLADGQLIFEIESNTKHLTKANTIRTPAGGQYQIRLPDGSEVWLNAKTSITFPANFNIQKREIELDGEAYFSIAKQQIKGKSIPFIVKSNQQVVEVLGTQFNVSNYKDENQIKTTLYEGSIKVSPNLNSSARLLKPGEQSNLINGTLNISEADLEQALAWKNGDFIFNNEDLFSIMKKISRWYDVEVSYENIPEHLYFSGAVSRYKNLSEALKIMELTGKVKFKIEGRRVLVMV